MALWTLEPNWPPAGQPYRVTYAFKTEVLTSHSGKEQRVALRSSPRKTLDFQVLLEGDGFRQFKDLSRASHHRGLLLPELTRFVTTTTLSSPGNVLTLPFVPDWIRAGVTVWIQFLSASETHVVESVVGNDVTFSTLDAGAWPVGTKVYPLLVGYLAPELTVRKLTNAVGTVGTKFEVSPLSEPVIPLPAPSVVYNGREVFLKKPNWANSVEGRFGRDISVLDYGRGPVSRFYPVDFSSERTKATYLNRTGAEATELLNLFLRMRGQQGEFYAPTWEYDFKPAGTVLAGSSGMLIDSSTFADDYRFSTVHKNVFVQFNDGTVILRKVTAITPVVDGAQLQVDVAWGRTFTAADIAMCGWLLVRRFSSDTLVVEWLTDSVAQVVLNLTTLEDLPG